MYASVGFCDLADTEQAGAQAAREALARGAQNRPCDMALLFATVRHDPYLLRDVVAAALGTETLIVGGSGVGIITNDRFGYAGDQVGVAAVWLDKARVDIVSEGGLIEHEAEVGERLGRQLAAFGTRPDTPAILLYDAIDRSLGHVRLNLATPLLKGIETGLGFLPDGLVGAGLQGDYDCSPAHQWIGAATVEEHAFMLTFDGGVRLDSVIMHGCRPASGYFTVTKADRQTVLEVDGQPALRYIGKQLTPALPPEAFPFFMIFGVNHDAPDAPFNEAHYANRLCLAIDRERDGIVMFESDLVEGTRFRIMYRHLNLDYIPPKIEALFAGLDGRRPVLAFYIDCAGRAAKYGGEDLEDAVVVQQAVAGRAPLLGIYSGVEIAPVMGRPSTLDWTGVFCLLSMPT